MLSSFIYRNCLLRVVAVGQSDSPESSHPPAVRKLSTPSDAHALVGFSRQMKVISVVSDIWNQSFYSTEASFQFNCYRGMSPRKFRSKPEVDFRSHETEKLPPYWNSRSQPNEALAIVVEWKLVFVWFVTWNYASDCMVQVHVSSTVHKWRIW